MEYKTLFDELERLNFTDEDDDLILEGSTSKKKESDFNDPDIDMDLIINFTFNQKKDPFPAILSLSQTVKSKIEKVQNKIIQKKFIPFLIQTIKEISFIDIKAALIRLIWLILKYYPSLHIVFFENGLISVLTNIIYNPNEVDINVLVYSIFSVNFLFKTYESTQKIYFEKFISLRQMEKKYRQVKHLISFKDPYLMNFLKGIVVLYSRLSFYPLSSNDNISVFSLSFDGLQASNKTIYFYSLYPLLNLIERNAINYEDFEASDIFKLIRERWRSDNLSNSISACNIFTKLFEKEYFPYHTFDINVNEVLDKIDCVDSTGKGYFLELLFMMIKTDQINGPVINDLYHSAPNEKGIRTICAFIPEGNFNIKINASKCLVNLFQKLSPEMIIESLELVVFKALIQVIQIGIDYDDTNLAISGLNIIYNILEFTKSTGQFNQNKYYEYAFDLFSKADCPEILLEFSQNENSDISNLANKIFKSCDDLFNDDEFNDS